MKRPASVPLKLSESLHQQLNAYALAAGAAGIGLLSWAQPAEAKIVYTPAHVHIRLDSCHYIDLNHDGINDFCLWRNVVHGASPFLGIYPNKDVIGDGAVGSGQWWLASAVALPRGAKIGSHDPFNDSPGMMALVAATNSHRNFLWYGQWANGGKGLKNGYLGLRFMIKGKTHFGWARVTVKTYQNFSFAATLTGYAYETIPGKAIIAGKTHGRDEATLGRLAQGASGVAVSRQKQ
jgi:hypothetical protein